MKTNRITVYGSKKIWICVGSRNVVTLESLSMNPGDWWSFPYALKTLPKRYNLDILKEGF
jgi:hypothetical protein